MEVMVKCNGAIPRRLPNFPPHGSVPTADLPSAHGVVLAWRMLAKERTVDASTLAE